MRSARRPLSVRDAGKAFRTMSENLDKRHRQHRRQFSAGSRGTGRREVEALSGGRPADALSTLNRTVRSLERDPSQVIFGGKAVVARIQTAAGGKRTVRRAGCVPAHGTDARVQRSL